MMRRRFFTGGKKGDLVITPETGLVFSSSQMVPLNVGCGSMYPPVVHNRMAFESDEPKEEEFRGVQRGYLVMAHETSYTYPSSAIVRQLN